MEQIDIKYSNIIRDELNVYDIYNTYVSLLDGKKLKSYFHFLKIKNTRSFTIFKMVSYS